MEHSSVTTDMVMEAGIAAAITANSNMLPPEISELSDQAAVFASDSTTAFKFTGGADADSTSTNFGLSLAVKAVDHMVELEAKRRKEDDPAGDAGMITELGAQQREERIRIGRISASRAELIAFSEAMQTPEFREAFRQHLIDQGMPEHEVDERMEAGDRMARTAQKIEDGTATQAEISQYEIDTSDPSNIDVLERGIEFQQSGIGAESRLALADQATSISTPTPTAEEFDLLAMMDAGGGVTNVEDRQGPVISGDFEMAANETTDSMPAPNTREDGRSVAQEPVMSFG